MKREDIGLTEVEFKIFRKIIEKGETALWPVIKDLGIHKGTAYNSIRRLEEKGLIGFKEVNKVNVYSANVLYLKSLLEKKKEDFKDSTSSIEEIIKIVESKKKEGEPGKVNVLVGDGGFKTFFNGLFDWAHKNRKEYLFMGRGNEILMHFGLEYYRFTQEKKKKLGIKNRVILNELTRTEPVSRHVFGNVRYLKMNYISPVSTWIFGDNVAIGLWGTKPLLTILIESKGAADSYRSYFEALWKTASK
jgi:predicted transcriptional regulator